MLDRRRLAQLCEMLRSDNDHERSVAARLATDLVRRANTTWTDVILQAEAKPASSRPHQSTDPPKSSDPFRRHPYLTPERNGVVAANLVALLLKKRSLSQWERNWVLGLQQQDLAIGLTDIQWRQAIRLAMEFGIWPGSKATRRRRKKRRY